MLRISRFKRGWLALALVAGSAAAAAAIGAIGSGAIGSDLATSSASKGSGTLASAASTGNANDNGLERQVERYIVLYREEPLATYRGNLRGLAAPERVQATGSGIAAKSRAIGGEGRIDAKGARSRDYVRHLRGVQSSHEGRIRAALGRQLRIEYRMQHALNGAITELTAAEAKRLRQLPEISLVEEYREYELETDTGPTLIGAAALWQNTPTAYRGEGTIVGIIDSGINFGSPSFAAQDESGYVHVNPNGAGNYLGTCAAGGIDAGRCNDKLIGGYDFVCAAPGNTCGAPDIREEPGFGDTNSHGSHTASTAAGNARTADFNGTSVRISGVAPRANIIAYDVCYTQLSTNRGLCPNTSSAAAVDQAIADGVDVINFSIGGGAQPWSESVSLAFLNATDAGVYVATSAGNSGPAANTLGHLEPWTASTAAAQHGRAGFAYLLQITGPGAVPMELRTLLLTEGSGGVVFNAALPAFTPVRVSAGIDTVDDACAAYPAGTFQGAIALVRRGTCSFAIKAGNAAAAGAVAVVVANNAVGPISPSVPGVTVPTFGLSMAEGNLVRNFAAGNGNTSTGGIGYPASGVPNLADVLGDFSSRGPAATFDLVKPDITAPGVSVLAVTAGAAITGFENAVGLMNGTSMASPHHAGAAALLRQARPDWTVAEIKSALMMTAFEGVDTEDTITPANAFAMGAGRIRVDLALRAGLLLNETRANYQAANPSLGGDVSSLNLPSLGKYNCAESCTFTRVFRNTLTTRQSWTVKLQGVTGLVSPSLLTLNPGESKAVKITVAKNTVGWSFGKLVLAPQGGNTTQPVLHLPVAVSMLPPVVAMAPEPINVALPANSTGMANFTLANQGGSRLSFTVDNTGAGKTNLVNAPVGAISSGFRSTQYLDPATAGNPGQYAADDFTVTEPIRITRLFTQGFVSSGQPLATTSSGLTWMIYRDSGDNPEGNPQTSPGVAVWSYSALPTGAGVVVNGADITLDLTSAAQNVNLAPGRYWLVVYSRSTFANRWVWFASNTGDGAFRAITPGNAGTGVWNNSAGFAGQAFALQGEFACGAPWIGAPTVAIGQIAAGASRAMQVQVNTAGLAAGSYTGYVCVASNDPTRPKAAVRVRLTVTPYRPSRESHHRGGATLRRASRACRRGGGRHHPSFIGE